MAEYIEREALMNEIYRIGGHNLCEWSTIGVKALVGRQPTADVAEVRHGKVLQLDHDEWWGAVYKCCECGEEFMLGNSKRALCCPYCGVYLSVRGEGE